MWGMLDDSDKEPNEEGWRKPGRNPARDLAAGSDDGSGDDPDMQLWGLFRPDEDLSWQHRALCSQTDPEVFFPEKGGSTRDAKRVCAQCEVRELCLQWAIDHDERFGIWGGLSERERRRYKREHREQA